MANVTSLRHLAPALSGNRTAAVLISAPTIPLAKACLLTGLKRAPRSQVVTRLMAPAAASPRSYRGPRAYLHIPTLTITSS